MPIRDQCQTCQRPTDDDWVVWCPVTHELAEMLRGDGMTTEYPVTLRLGPDDVIIVQQHYPPERDQPHPIDLVHDLRKALGLPVVALPHPPKQVWEEALAQVRALVRFEKAARNQEAGNA